MGTERLCGVSYDGVKAKVRESYEKEGKWFAGIQAWFAIVKHCCGSDQMVVSRALSDLISAVPQTPLRGRTGTTESVGQNPPDVQAALNGIRSNFNSEMTLFRIEKDVTKRDFQKLSDVLDSMLAEFYNPPLNEDAPNADKVHNAIYALKEKIDNFLQLQANVADHQVPPKVEDFRKEILSDATVIGDLPEWGT